MDTFWRRADVESMLKRSRLCVVTFAVVTVRGTGQGAVGGIAVRLSVVRRMSDCRGGAD